MTIFLAIIALTFSATTEASIDTLEHPSAWKVIRNEGRGRGRILFSADPVLLKLIENPDFVPDWEEVAVEEDGILRHRSLRNGWAYGEFKLDQDQTVLLEGGFHSLFVNGARFAGDYYSRGLTRIPVPLRSGVNRFFVRSMRSRELKLNIIPADGSCSISPHDALVPHMREDILLDSVGAVLILNHTGHTLAGAVLEVGDSEVFERVRLEIDPLISYGLSKPAFVLKQLRQPTADELDEKGIYMLSVTLNHGETTQTVQLPMPLRKADQPYKATKLSQIDESVQYYAVRPPINFDPERSYSLYLTVHGASVEATGQAAAYSSKRDGYVVAPTNRRPYGFDWQEWGRMDTMETLDIFVDNHHIDPERIYLTGHSMGGHGAWYLGALYPSRFGAIGPSAGWISFSSYARSRSSSEPTEAALLPFEWAGMENDTLALIENYTNLPIYIIHGEKDDNVPAEQSRKMFEELGKFHKDFMYHEEPGAGHWWDDNTTPGAECVDWMPLFEFFRRHIRSLHPMSIKFSTPNPAISASYAWLTIHSQIKPSALSFVNADADPRTGAIKISTDNVEWLKLDLADLLIQSEAKIQIDGVELSASTSSPIHLLKADEEAWKIADPPDLFLKGSHRNGPFKLAFDKRMVWVYGTGGSDEENAAILDKVRYDSQVWWYRGNGTVNIVADRDFDSDRFAGRNVILYGNADTNSAFDLLLKDCPIRINRHEVRIGEQIHQGDLGAFFVYPRPGSDENMVGVVGATSAKAMMMNSQARYFISGVACPDYVVFGADALSSGMAGILESGYFNNDWSLGD